MADRPYQPEVPIAHRSEGQLNLLHLIDDKTKAGSPDASAVPTANDLKAILGNTDHVRIFSAGNAQQLVGSEIDQLDKGDLKTIGDIAAALKKEPFDPKAMDKILEPYACFPDRLRNLLNPLDLWLQKQGIDRFHDESGHPGFAIDGGYADGGTDRSQYHLTINRNRQLPFYKYTLGDSCS
jgi:hypothetical protein